MTETTQTIDYSREAPLRRRLWRRVSVVLILMVVIVVARRTAPPIARQVGVLRQQSRMLNFTPAGDTVALSTDSNECDGLLGANAHVLVDVHYIGSGTGYGMKIAGFAPPIADPLFKPDLWGIVESPRGATLQWGALKGLPLGPPPTLFLHARRAPGRPVRLVHVAALLHHDALPLADARRYVDGEWLKFEKQQRADGGGEVGFVRLSLTPRVFSTASWRPGSRWMRVQPATDGLANDGEIPLPCRVYSSMLDGFKLEPLPLRIRCGVPDPADQSRFTLDYDVDGVAGVIDGCLGADDAVTWTILSGPLKQWPPHESFWGLTP